ncbi:MAG: hypothetical protein Q9218_002497 [Villophora microphyllina]
MVKKAQHLILMSALQRCLRPPATRCHPRTTASAAVYLRFYSVARALAKEEAHANNKTSNTNASLQSRKEALLRSGQELYPRFPKDKSVKTMSIPNFMGRFEILSKDETFGDFEVSLNGRVKSIRISGSGLAFLDLTQDRHIVQGVCVQGRIGHSGIRGKPYRNARGQLSLLVTELPHLQSPCLHEFPTALEDQETRVRNRHLDLQVNPRAVQTLVLRSKIIGQIRNFLSLRGYLEVQTPILANLAGGAIARAFETNAVEFPNRHIELRTAPELWLKRLVLGGLERIFEIGPCFRNEGLDKTHNPEFTTCEFYAAYIGLETLIETSERLFSELIEQNERRIEEDLRSLPPCKIDPSTPFRRLDFVSEIESAMELKLPDLQSSNAEAEVARMFHTRNIPLPSSLRLPRLLDRLAAQYLEPQCQSPTWITHHPECLSPLSKSFVSPTTNQRVAARAELFIAGKEVVNTYEEENSPFEQRRKFKEQIKYRDDGNKMDIDESYLEALEWGLPPTGGWGCGIDRLVMLLSGTDRINDVLPFGNLRNVVSLGKGGRDPANIVPKAR